MTPQQTEAFFQRIGVNIPESPSTAALAAIQAAHIATVPFENLDVIAGKVPLHLDTNSLYDKIVARKRGGICYELNLLLADALQTIGYKITLLSGAHPKYGDMFDHAFLLVKTCDSPESWITDVGFADNFCVPLPFPAAINTWVSDGRDEYQLRPAGQTSACPENAPSTFELVRRRAGQEALMFTFSTTPRKQEDYQPRCDWYATSPDSRFTRGPLICIDHPDGRISLTMNRIVNTYKGERIRTDISSKEDFDAALWELFGINV